MFYLIIYVPQSIDSNIEQKWNFVISANTDQYDFHSILYFFMTSYIIDSIFKIS